MRSQNLQITQLLRAWSAGNSEARGQLIPLVYADLRKIANRRLGRERRGHTLRPTDLVHELYLKIADQKRTRWHDRNHFFAVAAELMRRILVDHARKRSAAKRGGDSVQVELDDSVLGSFPEVGVDVIALDQSLSGLENESPRSAKVVELHAFGGLTFDEIAEVLDVARSTVLRDWQFARLWLRRALRESESLNE